MTFWNYRVCRGVCRTGEDFFEIKEVYYDNYDAPDSSCKATLCGESVEEVESTFAMMLAALDKPVLSEKDFE